MKENVMNEKAFWNAKGGKRVQERDVAGRGRVAHRALLLTGSIMVAVFLVGAMVGSLCAQSYPTKPIRFIIPPPPGGSVDTVGRIIALKLEKRLNQIIVCENRPGAGNNIGIGYASKARPDGYTIVLGTPGLAISVSLYKKLNYDAIKDLAPISLVAEGNFVLTAHPSLPVKDLKELVKYAKANPGKLNFGSAGRGSPPGLAGELLKSLAKIEFVHVPYKGAGPAMIGVVSGEVDFTVSSVTAARSQIKAGKVKPLAVLGKERLSVLPDVGTGEEAGVEGLVMTSWYGILAPAGTPREIVNRLNAELVKVTAMPDTKKMMNRVGLVPISTTPEQFAEIIKADIKRWAKVIKEANIPTID